MEKGTRTVIGFLSEPLPRGLIILLVAVLADHISHKYLSEQQALLFSVCLATCLFFFAWTFDYARIPKEFKKLGRGMADAVKIAESNRVLDIVLQQVIGDLEEKLDQLQSFRYVDDTGTIPDLSVRTIRTVEREAFATFVADTDDEAYDDPKGQEYLKAWYDKAKELGKDRVKRVFLTRAFSETPDHVVQLIKEHLSKAIGVSVVTRTEAEKLRGNCRLDFGLFDESCLMTVEPRPDSSHRLSVFLRRPKGANPEIAEHQAFKRSLLELAKSPEEFLQGFSRPMNETFWNSRIRSHHTRLGPPHGLSQSDGRAMLDLALKQVPPAHIPGRIAILGLTPELVNLAQQDARINEIILIDQTTVKQPSLASNVIQRNGNWLTYTHDAPFIAVLGDEALNNVNLNQYRSFFQSMHRNLIPDGILVLRTLGRFGEPDQGSNFELAELLDAIRQPPATPSAETDVERASLIIRSLHCASLGFDREFSLIRTAVYNGVLDEWVKTKVITPAQAEGFWFPDRLQRNLRLSSPEYDDIRRVSGSLFNELDPMDVDSRYWGNREGLRPYYQILSFQARAVPAT